MQNDAQERARGKIITRRAWRNHPFRPRLLESLDATIPQFDPDYGVGHHGMGTAYSASSFNRCTALAVHYRLVSAEEAKALRTAAESFAHPQDSDPSPQGLERSTTVRLAGSGIFGVSTKGASALWPE